MIVIDQPRAMTLGDRLGFWLNQEGKTSFDTLYMMVAYAKRSGVARIAPVLQNFRERGGTVRAIVGIDQRNTSVQAIRLLHHLSNELYIYHSESLSQTFHPKLYILERQGELAVSVVGSNNLTAGGLFTNYELSTYKEFHLDNPEDSAQFEEIKRVFALYSDTESPCCKRMSEDLLDNLVNQGYLDNEEVIARRGFPRGDDEGRPHDVPRLFGAERFVPPEVQIVPASEEREREVTGVTAREAGFWKVLSRFDVSTTGAPGQMIIPIRFMALFPPFPEPVTTPSNARQSEVFFNVVFDDPPNERVRINRARAIHYIPAPNHPRPNQELRFTFRNRSILERLRASDILEFRKSDSDDVWFVIHRRREGSEEHRQLTRWNSRFGLFD